MDWWIKKNEQRLRNKSEWVTISHHSSLFKKQHSHWNWQVSAAALRGLWNTSHKIHNAPRFPRACCSRWKTLKLSATPLPCMKQRQCSSHMFILFFHLSVSLPLKHTTYLQPLSCFIEVQCYWQCALPMQCSLLVLNYSQQDQLCAICVNFYAITSPNQNQADVREHTEEIYQSLCTWTPSC